jgi:hypothetical protein
MAGALVGAAALIVMLQTVTLVRVLQLGDAVGMLRERIRQLEGHRRPRRA